MGKLPICKTCVHHEWFPDSADSRVVDYCFHPSSGEDDLVRHQPESCLDRRNSEEKCGRAGRQFQQKPKRQTIFQQIKTLFA